MSHFFVKFHKIVKHKDFVPLKFLLFKWSTKGCFLHCNKSIRIPQYSYFRERYINFLFFFWEQQRPELSLLFTLFFFFPYMGYKLSMTSVQSQTKFARGTWGSQVKKICKNISFSFCLFNYLCHHWEDFSDYFALILHFF